MFLIKMFYAICNIRAQTIQLHQPVISFNGEVKRVAVAQNKQSEKLIAYETFLRKAAYKNTIIKTGDSFFDDSDMISDYFLVVVYDKKRNTPLLSARYYFDRLVISKCLRGDEKNEAVTELLDKYKFENLELFLSDRLSGNVNSPIYRIYRSYIFLLFYLQILIHNRNCKFILMARKEKHDKLLKKYLNLGLNTIGSTKHKDRDHWVLLGDVEHCYTQQKMPFLFKCIFRLKTLINRSIKNDSRKN